MSSVNEGQLAAVEPDCRWLCARLKELREVRGMRLTEVGAKMGSGHGRIGDTEHYRYDVKLSTILRIMSALGVTWEQVIKGAPRPSELPPVRAQEKMAQKKGGSKKPPKI